MKKFISLIILSFLIHNFAIALPNCTLIKTSNCKFIYDNGYVYEGERKNGKAHGVETLKYTVKDMGNVIQIGFFKNDFLVDGTVIQNYPDGFKTEEKGKFNNNNYLIEGTWIGTIPNGERAIKKGFFINGYLADGTYTYLFPNGEKVIRKGFFKDGYLVEGTDENILPDGKKQILEGFFKEGNLDGSNGIAYFFSGNKFIGDFKNGSPNGKGIYYWSSGIYYGDFKNGKWDGEGIISWNNGAKLISTFKDGNSIGIAKKIFVDGVMIEGNFDKNFDLVGTGNMYIKGKVADVFMKGTEYHYLIKGGRMIYNNKEKNFKMPKKEPLVSKPAKKKFKFNNFWSK